MCNMIIMSDNNIQQLVTLTKLPSDLDKTKS